MLTNRFLFAFGKLISDISKKYDYQNESCRDLYICIYVPEITHFSNFLSNHIVKNKNSIARKIFEINTKRLCKFLGKEILVPMNALANQAADRLMDNPENALKYGRY